MLTDSGSGGRGRIGGRSGSDGIGGRSGIGEIDRRGFVIRSHKDVVVVALRCPLLKPLAILATVAQSLLQKFVRDPVALKVIEIRMPIFGLEKRNPLFSIAYIQGVYIPLYSTGEGAPHPGG